MSCLFDSLSQDVGLSSYDLRQEICDYLSSNPKLFDDMSCEEVVKHESGMELQNYVGNMRQTQTMGGATEIKAFCLIFKKNVKIESVPNQKTIEFTIEPYLPVVHLRWTGGHYDLV